MLIHFSVFVHCYRPDDCDSGGAAVAVLVIVVLILIAVIVVLCMYIRNQSGFKDKVKGITHISNQMKQCLIQHFSEIQ